MSEKILIKGEFKDWNKSIIFYVLAAVTLIVCFAVAAALGQRHGIWWAFEGIEYGYYWFFIGAAVFAALGYWMSKKEHKTTCELTVTDKRIIGKTWFRRVDLPVSQVSMIGTGVFHRVSVATSAGSVHFCFVKNQEEVFAVISEQVLALQNTAQ